MSAVGLKILVIVSPVEIKALRGSCLIRVMPGMAQLEQ